MVFRKQAERNNDLKSLFITSRIDSINIDTSGSYIKPLVDFFKIREKKMVRKLLFILIIFAVNLTSSLYAQNIEVFAETDTTDYFVGDYINYSITLKYDNDINVYLPSLKDSLKNLEYIKEHAPVKSPGKNTQEVYRFVFAGYDSAAVTIPEFPITYKVGKEDEEYVITTNEVDINVHTLNVDMSADIRDIKNPLRIPLSWILIGSIITGILLLLVIAYLIYRHYKKKNADQVIDVPKVIIPPHKIALDELRKLEDKKLWQQKFNKRISFRSNWNYKKIF